MHKKIAWIVILTLVASMLASCGKSKTVAGDQASSEAPAQPLTISIYAIKAALSDTEFNDFMVEPVKKKYPNITLNLVRHGTQTEIGDLVAANQFPDIIFDANNALFNVLDYNLPVDLTPYAKKYNMDLNRFNKTAIDDIKGYSDKGELLAIPYSIGFSLLFYNKTIFDKFGVPYPKDGMSWDEAIALAKQVQRKDGAVQYYGINPIVGDMRKFGSPLSMPIIDPKTDKATINTEGWQKVFQQLKMITDVSNGDTKYPSFAKDQTLAMFDSYGDYFGNMEEAFKGTEPFDWDFTTMPSFKEAPGVGFRSLSHTLSISSTSQHKDEAFKVIQTLVGDENQLAMAKKGIRFPSIDDQKLKDAFGVDNPLLKGKNMQAIFKSKPAPNPKFTKYDSIIEKELNAAFNLVKDNKTDINTALRDAEDKANQGILSAKAAN